MASVVLSIPTPILSFGETFHVEIKNAAGATVFTDDVTNDPFTVTGLSEGDYTAYYTFNEATNGWCFTIAACGCPVLQSSEVVKVGVLYYGVFTFDMNSYQPTTECGFRLNYGIYNTGGILVDSNSRPFFSLSAFTDLGGGIYEVRVPMTSNRTIRYNIFSAREGSAQDVLCTPDAYMNYNCDGILNGTPPTITLTKVSGNLFLNITYNKCGGTCDSVTWNYIETNTPSTHPDTGSFTETVTCSPLGSSVTPLNPDSSNAAINEYTITGTDCCGNTYTKNIRFCASWLGTFTQLLQDVPRNIKLIFATCAAPTTTCNTLSFSFVQTNSAVGYVPDSGYFGVTINCGALPDTHVNPANPTPTIGGANPTYRLTTYNCCYPYPIGGFDITILP